MDMAKSQRQAPSGPAAHAPCDGAPCDEPCAVEHGEDVKAVEPASAADASAAESEPALEPQSEVEVEELEEDPESEDLIHHLKSQS